MGDKRQPSDDNSLNYFQIINSELYLIVFNVVKYALIMSEGVQFDPKISSNSIHTPFSLSFFFTFWVGKILIKIYVSGSVSVCATLKGSTHSTWDEPE